MKIKLWAVFFFVLLFIFPLTNNARANTGTWQKGVTLRLVGESNEDVIASLEQAKGIGANFVSITPGWLTNNIYSSNVERKANTPTDEKLIYSINKSHELGMQVMLKPHLDRKDGGWRAFIDPIDTKTFFENYSQMMLHYAVLAEQHGVEQLSVGAELYKLSTNLNNEQYWRDMITQIRSVYSGKLTYSANAGDTPFDEGNLPFWDMLDYWGLSMYIEVADNTSPTMESITQKWSEFEQNYLLPRLSTINLPVLATEIGYRSVNGAGMDPGNYSMYGNVDLAEQNLLYQAFFEYWKNKDYFIGIHIWDWNPNVNSGGPLDKDYTPQNKPAGELIKAYFTNQFEPLPDTLIFNVKPLSYSVAALTVNQTFYSDRTHRITSLPDILVGKDFIKSKNSDKFESSESFVYFELAAPATVLVAFDSRVTILPDWLASWNKTAYTINTTDVPFNLYKRTFEAGPVVLGGNNVSPMAGAQSNCFVIAMKEDTENEPPPEQEEIIEEVPVQSAFQGDIVVLEPTENKQMSGEKKLKVYIDGLELNDYTLYYNVEGKGEVKMGESSYGFKQSKIDFDEWNWHGDGLYTVVLTAYDNDKNLIDSKEIQIYVKN